MINLLEEIKSSQYLFPNNIDEILEMKGTDFEDFIYWYLKKQNYDVKKTTRTNDSGIDLYVDINNENNEKIRLGIQCKRWSSPIPKEEVVKTIEGKSIYSIDKIWIISTSRLTSEANLFCTNNSIDFKGIDYIKKILNDLNNLENIQRRECKKIQKQDNHQDIILNEKEQNIFEKLKILRLNYAKEERVPAYIIFTDKTLINIIKNKPKTIDDLNKIDNLSKLKIHKYGTEILKILNDE